MPGRARDGAKAPVRRHAIGARAHAARCPRVYATAPVGWVRAPATGSARRASSCGTARAMPAIGPAIMVERARRGFFDTLHEQPLVLGALGLAAGAAIGAALPTTDKEDEWLGDSRDRLAERAKEAGWEQVEKARAAAGAAYSAAREEAERQGLTLEGGKAAAESAAETVRHKAERVAEAATEAAKTEAERQNLAHSGSKDA